MKDKVPPLDVCHLLSKAVAELAEKYELDLIAIDARNASASLERQVANLKGALLAYKGEQVRQREECFEEQLKMKDEKELKSLKVDIHDLSDSIKDIQDDLQRLDIFATGTPSMFIYIFPPCI
uniref:Uncharacterized protein n=1 Tax=Plectus sambesii TaxID=2011161 RepID=A0A914VBE7_9BILA